jgi:hypothetical protein
MDAIAATRVQEARRPHPRSSAISQITVRVGAAANSAATIAAWGSHQANSLVRPLPAQSAEECALALITLYPAQQDSFVTSFSNARAASFNPSTVVRYGKIVSARSSVVSFKAARETSPQDTPPVRLPQRAIRHHNAATPRTVGSRRDRGERCADCAARDQVRLPSSTPSPWERTDSPRWWRRP